MDPRGVFDGRYLMYMIEVAIMLSVVGSHNGIGGGKMVVGSCSSDDHD